MKQEQVAPLKMFIEEKLPHMASFAFLIIEHDGTFNAHVNGNLMQLGFMKDSMMNIILKIMNQPREVQPAPEASKPEGPKLVPDSAPS